MMKITRVKGRRAVCAMKLHLAATRVLRYTTLAMTVPWKPIAGTDQPME